MRSAAQPVGQNNCGSETAHLPPLRRGPTPTWMRLMFQPAPGKTCFNRREIGDLQASVQCAEG
eukprot:985832-Alexandrium_andersonii.AAC.1